MSFRKIALFATPLVFISCTVPTQNQAAQQGQTDPNNPYAVPGISTQGSYAPPTAQIPTAQAPYQALPNIPVNPPASIPSYTPPVASSSGSSSSGSSHTVSGGDTLWGLSQKYGVSVDDIRQANGITGTVISKGQTLVIPR